MVKKYKTRITEICRDGRIIKLNKLTAKGNSKTAIIAPAMGVRRFFYHSIGTFLVKEGFNVLSFDYFRMIHTAETCKKVSSLKDWGKKDIAHVIDYARESFPKNEIFFLGHSIAGQLLPLAPNNHHIKAVVLIASQAVSYRHWIGWRRLQVKMLWHMIIPASLATLKYLPAASYGGKYDLHHNIARDWANWAKNRDGVLGAVEGAKTSYSNFAVPTCFLSFHDDTLLAPYAAVEEIYDSYGTHIKKHIHIGKNQLHQKNIGHFGFFREEYSYLWENVIHWFNQHSRSSPGRTTKRSNRKNHHII